jgi:hypothetical protein
LYIGRFYGGAVGWTQMDMPEHANAAINFDLGGGLASPTLQADVDGVSYALGVGRNSEGGWRTVLYASFFDGDGSSSDSFSFLAATPVRRGTLAGLTQFDGASGGNGTGAQTLDVDVDSSTFGLSFGRALSDMFRADLVVSYSHADTAYRNNVVYTFAPPLVNPSNGSTNTNFESRTVEFAGRLSAGFPLSDAFSVGIGGSAGWAMRDIQMAARQRIIVNNVLLSDSSLKAKDDDITGFIGRLDASLDYAVSAGTRLGLTAGYVYDEQVPVYVPPVYPAAGTGSAAGFATESQTTMTYGVRLVGNF